MNKYISGQKEQKKEKKEKKTLDYLLIVGETSHDSWVYDPIQQHRKGIDGKVGIIEMSLHHAADLLIG